jgi:hypothetical protein
VLVVLELLMQYQMVQIPYLVQLHPQVAVLVALVVAETFLPVIVAAPVVVVLITVDQAHQEQVAKVMPVVVDTVVALTKVGVEEVLLRQEPLQLAGFPEMVEMVRHQVFQDRL